MPYRTHSKHEVDQIIIIKYTKLQIGYTKIDHEIEEATKAFSGNIKYL